MVSFLKKRQMSLYGDLELDLQLLQLINAWPIELWNGYEHIYFEKMSLWSGHM